jgi:hypothetical protein
MPTHAMRLHEWGTRSVGTISCVGHPPVPTWFLGVGFVKFSGFGVVGQFEICWLSVHHLEKILSKSTKRPVFLYSAIRCFVCVTRPKIRIAMTPMSSTPVPSCFAIDRIEDQFMPAMLSRFAPSRECPLMR